MVPHVYCASSWEVEGGGSKVQEQSGLHSEFLTQLHGKTLSQKHKSKQTNENGSFCVFPLIPSRFQMIELSKGQRNRLVRMHVTSRPETRVFPLLKFIAPSTFIAFGIWCEN